MRWLMAQFMADRLGEEYQAFVIGVRRNGFFVELVEHFVEGFVPVETMLDDFYVFNQRHHCLIGENSRKAYRIRRSTQSPGRQGEHPSALDRVFAGHQDP